MFPKRHQHVDLLVRVVESQRSSRVLVPSNQDERLPKEAIRAQDRHMHVQHAEPQDNHYSRFCIQEKHRRHSVSTNHIF